MRAVDVDDVKRHSNPGDAPRLGDELVRDEVRRDLVQDARYLERERTLTSQLSWRAERHRRQPAAHGRHGARCVGLEFGVLERPLEHFAGGEVAVERGAADVCSGGELGHRHMSVPDECAGGSEDSLTARECIGARRS